jgi:hypothetical protein
VEELGIPRSTLQHWLSRKDRIDAAEEVVSFFESPVGTAFLHRLAIGAHFVMTMSGTGSIRQVCQFFELTGLDRFIASSYGAQQIVSVKMEQAIVDFDQEERKRLAEAMPSNQITVFQDETFHPETCLVAIEPVSNFILLEKYSESRKSSEWTKSMEEAVKGLPVKIVQSTSDEGKGILHHVKSDLGAHHAPDVFHVQHEIVKGTSAVLASKTRQAEMELERTATEVKRCVQEKEEYRNSQPGPGRPPQFEKRIEAAVKNHEAAQQNLKSAESHQKRMKEAVQRISEVYHPVDLKTGKLMEPEKVSASLEDCFAEIEAAASEAGLMERSLKRIRKARKVLVDMIATILFFHMTIKAKVEALSLPPKVEKAVMEKLIPGLYIKRVSKQAKGADERHRPSLKSSEILELLDGESNPFSGLTAEELRLIGKVGEECANLFQRSSSCVEGRNGQLSLRHHSLHRLNNRKLAALTAVHNYFVKRVDGTTPAERLFGTRPRELFETLLTRIDIPGRPAQHRV